MKTSTAGRIRRLRLRLSMADGQRTQIVLLDDRKLDIIVQPKLTVEELLSIVASHCNLKDRDKQYFGLAFLDEMQQYHWLQPARRVLDHEYPKKFTVSGSTLMLYHLVKFFIDSICLLQYTATVELFFLYAKSRIYSGLIEADSSTIFELAAYLLQAYCGDYTDDNNARNALKKLPVMPSATLKEHPSLSFCEERVIEFYKKFAGQTKGTAVVNYMSIVESLPSYGVHLFDVKDKSGMSWNLGISHKGIFQFEHLDSKKPRKIFLWKQLENLYYRDRKFSIEVHDPRRVVHMLSSFNLFDDLKRFHQAQQQLPEADDDLASAIVDDPTTHVSVSRRTFGPSNVHSHAFICSSAAFCRSIWSMAICQHQFYLDSLGTNKNLCSSKDEIAQDLTQSMACIPSAPHGPLNTCGSASSSSLQSIHSNLTEKSEEDKLRESELYALLKERKNSLEEQLKRKLKQLKELCIQEAQLTGELPPETVKALAPGEAKPVVQRRVGTAFTLPEELVAKQSRADKIAKLEVDIEVQKKINQAALKLANDRTTNKSVRRKRLKDYERSYRKLTEMQQALHHLRLSSSRPDLPTESTFYSIPKLSLSPSGSHSAPGTPSRVRAPRSAPSTPPESPCLRRAPPAHPSVTPVAINGGRLDYDPRLCSGSVPHLYHSSSFPCAPLLANNISEQQTSPCFGNTPTKGRLVGASSNPTLHRIVQMSANDVPNNGYRSNHPYQSEYRLQTYPTLSNSQQSVVDTSLPDCSGTANCNKSNLPNSCSLPPSSGQNLPLSATVSRLMRLHSNKTDVGAYNIPNQRTSWNQFYPTDSLENVNVNNCSSLEHIPSVNGSTQSINNSTSTSINHYYSNGSGLIIPDPMLSGTGSQCSPAAKPPVPCGPAGSGSRIAHRTSSATSCTTSPVHQPHNLHQIRGAVNGSSPSWNGGWNSLDRKLLKQRHRTRTEEYLRAVQASCGGSPTTWNSQKTHLVSTTPTRGQPRNSPHIIRPLDHSPTRYPVAMSNGGESPVLDLDRTLVPDESGNLNLIRRNNSSVSACHMSPSRYLRNFENGHSTQQLCMSNSLSSDESCIVLTKSYESSDFFKYSNRFRINNANTASALAMVPPDPKHSSTCASVSSLSSSSFSNNSSSSNSACSNGNIPGANFSRRPPAVVDTAPNSVATKWCNNERPPTQKSAATIV